MGRVEVAGTAIGGLDEEQALSAMVAVEEEYLGRPAVFNIEGKVVEHATLRGRARDQRAGHRR